MAGSINNVTRSQQWNVNAGRTHLSGTDTGPVATITASDSLSLDARKDISIAGAEITAGGSLGMSAGNDINIAANPLSESDSRHGGGMKPATAAPHCRAVRSVRAETC